MVYSCEELVQFKLLEEDQRGIDILSLNEVWQFSLSIQTRSNSDIDV